MKTGLNILGGALAALGAVWTLQGAGLLGGSFMTGQTKWRDIGIVCVVAGAMVLGWVNLRRR